MQPFDLATQFASAQFDVVCETIPSGDSQETLARLRDAFDFALTPTFSPVGPALYEKALQLRGKRFVSPSGVVAGPLGDAQAAR